MPSVMQNAADWLGDQLKTLAGRTVVFVQGPTESAELTGWCAQQDYDVMDEEGFATQVRAYDWQFKREDIPAGFTLRAGTVVKETVGSTVSQYEAMPIGTRPAVENHDTSGQLVTLHTKQVA